MKTLLINPHTPDYLDRVGTKNYFPLGLGYIAAVLEKQHEVKVIDVQAEGLDDAALRRNISDMRPEIVGITAATPAFQLAIEIADSVKQINKDTIVVIGGVHSNAMPSYPLKYSCFDISVYGEGERTAVELWERLERGQSYEDVKGISFREKDRIVVNPMREFIENLDELPFPARHLFPLDKYDRGGHVSVAPIYSIGTSRGCPFSCAFCSNNAAFGRKYRFRSAQNVVDEVELVISQYGAKGIYFREDIFTVNKQRVMDICSEIVNRGLDFRWECECRVDTIDREMLHAMKRAGCEIVWGGFESGSQRVLDYLNKQITVSQMRKACNLCNEVGIKIGASFMMGIPGETMDEIQATINLARELRPQAAFTWLSLYVGYPTSQLYEFVRTNKLYEEEIGHGILVCETPEFNWRILREVKEQAMAWIGRGSQGSEGEREVPLKLLPATLDNVLRIRDGHTSQGLEPKTGVGDSAVPRSQKNRDDGASQLRAIKNSVSYRLGSMLVQAVVSPGRNTLLLPYRLIRLFVKGLREQRTAAEKCFAVSTLPRGKLTEVRLTDVRLGSAAAMVKKQYVERFGVKNGRVGGYSDSAWKRVQYVSTLLPEAETILDVGIGTGAFLSLLISLARFQRIVGIDVRLGSKFATLPESSQCSRLNASVTNLPFADRAVDVVTCMEVLEHIDGESFAAALPELRRVAKRLLIITVPYNEPEPLYRGHKLRFTDAELKTYFPSASFVVLRKPAGAAWVAIIEDALPSHNR